jgi:hypothetical protein
LVLKTFQTKELGKRKEEKIRKKKKKGLGDPFQPNPENIPRPGMTKTRTGTRPHPLPR